MSRRGAFVVVVVGLAATGCGRDRPITEAARMRERYVRDLAEREGMAAEWALSSRSDLRFEDGLAPIEVGDPPTTPGRWMGPRAHLRIRGDHDGTRRLVIHGEVDLEAMHTRPVVAASVDGREVHSAQVELDGRFTIDTTLAAGAIADWADVYVTLSSVHEPWKDPEGKLAGKLTVARLTSVSWAPVQPIGSW